MGAKKLGENERLLKLFRIIIRILQICFLTQIVLQVDLKFEVRRGASARKLLVKEAKSFGAATLLAGTSSAHYTIRSSASVVKYCARKLPKCISVFAVDNGKVVFHRDATNQGIRPHVSAFLFRVLNSFDWDIFTYSTKSSIRKSYNNKIKRETLEFLF